MKKKIRIDIQSTEYEFFAVDAECEEGYNSYGYTSEISSIEVEGKDVYDDNITTVLSDDIIEISMIEDTDNKIVGIRAYENECSDYIEIEDIDFDPSKLTLVFANVKFIIDDDHSYTTDSKLLSAVIYDGQKCSLNWVSSENFGSEIVWGIDPEEDDYEDEDEDWDEEE